LRGDSEEFYLLFRIAELSNVEVYAL